MGSLVSADAVGNRGFFLGVVRVRHLTDGKRIGLLRLGHGMNCGVFPSTRDLDCVHRIFYAYADLYGTLAKRFEEEPDADCGLEILSVDTYLSRLPSSVVSPCVLLRVDTIVGHF